jgi:large subunit ribosomal protein L16
MGRGKGNVDHWVCVIKPGRVLFEVISKDTKIVKEILDFTLRKLPFFAQRVSRDISL